MTLLDLLPDIPTPAYVADLARLKANLATAARVRRETGTTMLLATKAFAMPALFPLFRDTLDGNTASGLFEARMGREEFGKQVHVYSPAYKESEFDEILGLADDVYFNSAEQVARYLPRAKAAGRKVGLRINPGFSNSTVGGDLYNPCSSGSRFGAPEHTLGDIPWGDIDILHAHALCQSGHAASIGLIERIAGAFGHLVNKVSAVNFGGGHYFNDPAYDVDALIAALNRFRDTFPHVETIMEPGGTLVMDAGYLVATVLDVYRNDKTIAILDASAPCHMPDVLIAGWHAPVIGAGGPGEKPHTYTLAGNTCMTGDIIGEYSFDAPLKPGDRVIFGDQLQYSFVQASTFNGVPLPDFYALHEDGSTERLSRFSYDDFRSRLGNGIAG